MNRSYTNFSSSDQQKAPAGATDEVIDISALLGTLWRGKWLIALVTLIALIIGGYYAYGVATPLFRATAVVILDSRQEKVVDFESVVGGLGRDATTINSEVEVLQSRNLLEKVVKTLDLTSDPEFNPSLRSPPLKAQIRNWIKRTANRLFTGEPTPASAPTATSEALRQQRILDSTVNQLLRTLTISTVPQSVVFEITVETEEAQKSARIADTLVDQYIMNQLDVKFAATEQATSWLSKRVAELQTELEGAEARVKNFNANTELVSTETLIGLERQIKELRVRIDNATAERDRSATSLARLQAAKTPQEQAELANDATLNRILLQIDQPGSRETFQQRYDQLVARAQVEADRAENQLAALEKSSTELASQIDRQNTDLITLQQLTREAEASRLLYEYFLTRLKETSAQEGTQQADSRVLSNAVIPGGPSAPRKSLVLIMSAFFGVLLGAGIVLLRELRQNTFRTARDLEQTTGLSVMGQLPLLPMRHRKDVIKYLVDKPTSAAAEAVRNLRTSVLLSNIDHPPQVIATSSSTPGEGKTTVSMALAHNFIGLGKKVLLIEGDIRRRVFNQYLDTEAEEGLVAVLTGKRKLEDVVLKDNRVGADVLIGEQTATNAADLFSSESFVRFLKDARTRYDTIIIDTPPVLVVPDARVIAQHVDAMLFVVAWDRTQKGQVEIALQMFESANQPIAGLVLNQISPKGMKRYGYGGKYGAYANYGRKYYVD
ncbi:polysaccharide biosynthesis tyrosine autokinase [Pseudooceanicola sediminis]|uniref:non-specific protein-tyrosine kinase n=1 Tax=Pseudooceanicola sediminis TaxID=2211117 RepID=A0A399IW11_9RHOB|nr:polysaccharide biosynthesis tyrosine autokinase [Pseudooceanicola sediminis]KAA2311695.1 polysaccharide biosynthesis tyrosine autokinase [Puniceibacterium sp. HSS470]RII37140.1 polysaccharide biosynthesis tyrosine autokinase [Pseudooceanicola sediminis]|tara:strand:- start:15857 stop:18022 length:2166 start_codon:yes stop_codon:yes gene_type:complete